MVKATKVTEKCFLEADWLKKRALSSVSQFSHVPVLSVLPYARGVGVFCTLLPVCTHVVLICLTLYAQCVRTSR